MEPDSQPADTPTAEGPIDTEGNVLNEVNEGSQCEYREEEEEEEEEEVQEEEGLEEKEEEEEVQEEEGLEEEEEENEGLEEKEEEMREGLLEEPHTLPRSGSMVVGARAPGQSPVFVPGMPLRFQGSREEYVWAGGDPDFVFSSFQRRRETPLQNPGTLGKQKPGPICYPFPL
ncbi:unnamed protein product [Boreogadus saida]